MQCEEWELFRLGCVLLLSAFAGCLDVSISVCEIDSEIRRVRKQVSFVIGVCAVFGGSTRAGVCEHRGVMECVLGRLSWRDGVSLFCAGCMPLDSS